MPLQPGDKLGRHEILSAVGAGGQGEVYKARDTRLDRSVAVKVLPEHIARREDLRATRTAPAFWWQPRMIHFPRLAGAMTKPERHLGLRVLVFFAMGALGFSQYEVPPAALTD